MQQALSFHLFTAFETRIFCVQKMVPGILNKTAPPYFLSEFRDYLYAMFPGTYIGLAEPIA
jgi:hypothetical protein